DLWWGIQPIAAGVFGAPAAFLTIIVGSLLTPPADPATTMLGEYLRQPDGKPPALPSALSARRGADCREAARGRSSAAVASGFRQWLIDLRNGQRIPPMADRSTRWSTDSVNG